MTGELQKISKCRLDIHKNESIVLGYKLISLMLQETNLISTELNETLETSPCSFTFTLEILYKLFTFFL